MGEGALLLAVVHIDDVAVPLENVLVDDEALQPDRTPAVQAVSADADFGP